MDLIKAGYLFFPSFYSFLLYLILITAFLIPKLKISLPVIIITALFYPLMHQTSIFSLFAISLFALGLFIWKWKVKNKKEARQILFKLFILLLIQVIVYVGFMAYFNKQGKSIAGSSFIATTLATAEQKCPWLEKINILKPENIVNPELNIQSGAELLEKSEKFGAIDEKTGKSKYFKSFYYNYLLYISPHPIFYLFWLLLIVFLVKYKRWPTLFIYGSGLIFTILSCLAYTYGFRALIYLWPFTFLLLAEGLWFIGKYLVDKYSRQKKIIIGLFILVILLLSIGFTIYNLTVVSIMNQERNYTWDRNILEKLEEDEKQVFVDQNIYVLYLSQGGKNIEHTRITNWLGDFEIKEDSKQYFLVENPEKVYTEIKYPWVINTTLNVLEKAGINFNSGEKKENIITKEEYLEKRILRWLPEDKKNDLELIYAGGAVDLYTLQK